MTAKHVKKSLSSLELKDCKLKEDTISNFQDKKSKTHSYMLLLVF